MENPSDSLQNRISSIPPKKILGFAGRAQKHKTRRFSGFELKEKNLNAFKSAIAELYVKGDSQARSFVDSLAPIDVDSEDEPLAVDPGTQTVSYMTREIQESRDHLLDMMKDLVETVQSQTEEMHALRIEYGTNGFAESP